MTMRRTFAIGFTVLSVAGFVAQIVLKSLVVNGNVMSWGFAGVFLLFALVGGLIVLKQPYNLVGWLLLAVGVLECVDGSGIDAYVASASGGWRTVGLSVIAWGEGSNTIGPGVATLMLLFFPTGRLLPRKRWRFAVAIVVRFRRSQGEVREQRKWMGLSAAFSVVGLGSLILAYLGIVLALGAGTRAMGSSSDLAVAVSTLAVAALFQPARYRVQDLVDRRFNRCRDDAVRTVEEFGATLRDEVKLAHLAADRRHLVGATLAPAHASVWLAAGDP